MVAALLIVYVVWSTTYHATNVAMQTLPPLLMNGVRFLVAGLVMLGIARWQRQPWPTAAQWRNSALIGALMVVGAMTMVMLAQRMGIGSGLMATVVTTMPMWLVLWSRLGGETVPVSTWIGLLLGVAGAGLLVLERDFAATWLGGLLAFGAPLCWSIGSYASRRLALPAPAMASAAQWLLGGLMGTASAFMFEPAAWSWTPDSVSLASALAWLYLLVMGTLVTLNAYLWLLQNTSAALAGSYSFVNPVLALWVGMALGGEKVTGQIFIALPLILLALACIAYGQSLWRWWAGLRAKEVPVAVVATPEAVMPASAAAHPPTPAEPAR
jgi:drug/metabolite transporter (DMT)-like permease